MDVVQLSMQHCKGWLHCAKFHGSNMGVSQSVLTKFLTPLRKQIAEWNNCQQLRTVQCAYIRSSATVWNGSHWPNLICVSILELIVPRYLCISVTFSSSQMLQKPLDRFYRVAGLHFGSSQITPQEYWLQRKFHSNWSYPSGGNGWDLLFKPENVINALR